MRLDEIPTVAAHILDGLFGRPAEDILGLGRVRPALGKITVAACADDVVDLDAIDLLKRVDQLQNAHCAAGAEVERLRAGVVLGVLERLQVALGQIDDVQIVAQAGAVGRGIVVAENRQLFELSGGDAGDIGHQIVGNAVGILTQQTGFVRTDGVEVTQQDGGKFGIGRGVIAQDLLDHDLCPAVGIRGQMRGHGLDIGHGVLRAVDRRGGREHQLDAAVCGHGLDQRERGVEVVAVISQRDAAAFAHGLEAGEVDDGVDLMRGENFLQRGAVADIRLVEHRFDARDGLNLLDDIGLGIGQIVHDNDLVPRLLQLHAGVASDKPGAAGDKYFH